MHRNGQTDGQTDRQTDRASLYGASFVTVAWTLRCSEVNVQAMRQRSVTVTVNVTGL